MDIVHVIRMKPLFEASNEWQLPQEIAPNNLEEAAEKEQREDQEIESQHVPLATSPQAVADDDETVTEHPTADGVMVPNLFGTIPDAPVYSLQSTNGYVTDPERNHNFKEHVDVTFGESAWTIVTDLDLGPAGAAIAYLQQQKVADKWKQQGFDQKKNSCQKNFQQITKFLEGTGERDRAIHDREKSLKHQPKKPT
ncbi:hypothetical protein OUZ56_016692 [Daphnia magna]|uniref:Uncharacterized protein n=1 Tax=Daphnia magna TaxID=35525 RepID=A0ABR0AR93_9CRUS|nr:hypothetical protein OUZ56_016692 [Daphnia magna]